MHPKITQGGLLMKRASSLLTLFTLCFLLLFVFSLGCAKKSVVKEEAAAKEQAGVAQKEGEAAVKEQAVAAPVEKEKAVAEAAPAVTEEAARERATVAKGEVKFENIHFDFDKFNLKPEAREILKRHAEWLAKHGEYNVVIEGHCDERGTNEYNLALGARRAGEAMKYFVELGVDAKRIKTISYGEEKPLDPGHNEEAWAKNRRDQFSVTPK